MKHGYFTGDYSLRRPRYVKYFKILRKPIYPFVNDPYNPLTFHRPDGIQIRPLAIMDSDMGTVPRCVRVLIPKDGYLDSYLLHDSGYMQGGYSVSNDGGKTWGHVQLSRKLIDQQLRDCIKAQQAVAEQNRSKNRWWSAITSKPRQANDIITRNAVYRAVRAGGGWIWRRRY